jgi:hypothetical protein
MSLNLMSFKKFFALLCALLSVSIVGLSLLRVAGVETIPLPFISSGPDHSLTGMPGSDAPVLVVKYDDTTYAHPQVGLKDADVVYIEQVEGGLTRLAAVFSSHIPELVGPVRSARISDIELLAQYGKVGFAYSGAQSKLRPVIAAANLFDVGANKYGPTYYAKDLARVAPYAMMLKSQLLMEKVLSEGKELAVSQNLGWNFGDAPNSLRSFSSVHISWPASSYDAQWSSDQKRWLLTHNGTPDVDDTGYQLGPKTFVIQIASITDSIYHDKVGGVTPFTATVGEGQCFLLRDGGVSDCRWSRSSADSGTTFSDLEGKELTFDRGQVWIALTSKLPIFTGLAGATPSTTK